MTHPGGQCDNNSDYFVTMAGRRNAAETNLAGAGGFPPGLAALIARRGPRRQRPPPVERWNPPFCGEIDMGIAATARWFYRGTPIGRKPLVRLFASVLRQDEDGRRLS